MVKTSDNELVMSARNTPFYIVLLASALPWVAAAADSKMLTYIPDVVAVTAYLLFAARYPERVLRIHPYFATVLLLVLFHVTFGLVSGRGIGSAGLVSLFVLTFIFSKLLDQNETEHSAAAITWQIGLIYIIHVVFILAELLFRLAGHTDILVAIAGHATEVTMYKTYNSATLLVYLGIEGISGMNSMLLGSQSASQLVLLAAFWFAHLYKGLPLPGSGSSRWLWFILAVVLFPFVASMTATLMLVILALFLIYVLPNSILNRRSIWVSAPLLAGAFSGVLFPLLAFRMPAEGDATIYMKAFMAAPLEFLDLSLLDQIMGFGRDILQSQIAAADFGIAMLTFQTGVYLVGLALICMILMVRAVCHAIRRNSAPGFAMSPWAMVAGVNTVCAIGWAISLVHYTPAIELGGRHLFALHLAACLVALKSMAVLRRTGSHTSLSLNTSRAIPASPR